MSGSRFSAVLTPLTTSVVGLAVLGGLAVQPGLPGTGPRMATVGNDFDWYEETAAEQLRQDQCLMAEVLRMGGPAMAGVAQGGLDLPPEGLHTAANPKYWEKTPLSTAYEKDQAAADKELAGIFALRESWEKPLAGLSTVAGINDATFHWPPGTREGEDFHSQTGLTKWIADRFWKSEGDPYEDPTPPADAKARKAVIDLGTPLYGKDPDSTTSTDWARDVAENEGFKWLKEATFEPTGADNARLFLANGGFPRTGPVPGSPEYRIAVEDLKTRFSTCAWRDPIDPNKVMGPVAGTAAAEWQQEIASQAVQRNQVVDASENATKALATGARALGQMLGHSWVADHLTRWQDYWSAGGVGWIGDVPSTIQLKGATGKCLEVQGGGTANGTPVQAYTCNGTSAQQWQMEGDDLGLHLRNVKSMKCLDVAGNGSAVGTKIQIQTCNSSSQAQTWEYTPRATTQLRGVGSGKCLNFATYDAGKDALLANCATAASQQFTIKPSGHNGEVQPKAHFDQAAKGVADARAGAKGQLAVIKQQAAAAKVAVATSDTAMQAAYAIADKNGAPRGRGLLVGLQKDQVTKGVAAALDAMVKAGETAEAATRAAAADSDTIAQRALAQASLSKAEFRKEAARAAEWQAKAAADGAKFQRDTAKKEKETAEAKLAVAVQAEATAKAAAADARARRLSAEAEEKTAEKEKLIAAAKQGEAAQHRKNAEAEAVKAQDARKLAETAEGTAVEKKNAAVKAKDKARDLRDDAWAAEQKADAARAKADAKEAFAQAHESDENAQASREAADAADAHADAAEAAAGRARGEADAATQAAADADAAATRAEAAAGRARADADAAQAAKLRSEAAVKTATSAVADALDASRRAADAAKTAQRLAAEAEASAKEARTHADEAKKEAAKALAAASRAAGYAHVTAQAAVDAGNSAAQVARPANDAIQLGSPYVTTDSAAGLVVLTGQASKTIAEQQKAVADAHAKNAKEEAAAAKAIADAATGEAKQAYVHAANAAAHAADARGYATEALGYAADAARAASKAAESLARTVEYDRRAGEDAAAADAAAGRAENHATTARASADQAALDAEAARDAAAAAEQAAKDARAAADRADAAATEAETAAKDALKYAKEAQEAAESAARKQANQQIKNGAGTGGIGGTFFVVDEDSVKVTDAKQKNDCVIEVGFTGCTVTFDVTFDVEVDFFLCTDPDVPATATGCPATDTVLIDRRPFKGLKKEVTQYFSKWDLIEQTLVYKVLRAVLIQDFIDCWRGSAGGCAWAASNFVPGKAFSKIAEALNALDAAMKTGVGVADAYKALKAIEGLDPATLARITQQVNLYEDAFTSCVRNSFPGHTPVLMADGTYRPIARVAIGDLVKAADPASGELRTQKVTATFRHGTERLVDVTLAGGGKLTSTAGHKFFVADRGWTTVADLRVGDRLRTPEGAVRTVRALRDRTGLAPTVVHDITVDGPHTFFVRATGARPQDVLVHNCLNIVADEGKNGAHTLGEHVLNERQAWDKAAKDGIATVWNDQDTAVRCINEAFQQWVQRSPKNLAKLTKWINDQRKLPKSQIFDPRHDLFPIEWELRGEGSLGKIYRDGATAPVAAGNRVVINIKAVRGSSHAGDDAAKVPNNFVIYTAYPK
ncbi:MULTISPECIES: ricin-type beta-trefoil lectin domain protein [unclassified Streptomyces]|uniref:ricin-type beta-trefoil lectin domain protein n=1 Tax=unclassified Streptomyces TaxID=2593676 RepID=UPI0036C351F7